MLQNIAEEFVKMRFEKINGVIGVLLIGSAVTDYVDQWSDVDLQVVVSPDLGKKLEKYVDLRDFAT